MGILDAPLRNVSASLIRQFGQAVTITFRATGAYNATTGTAAKTDSSVTARGLVEPYKARFQAGEADSARVGDLQVTVAAQGLPRAPAAGDTVTVGGQEHEVVEVAPTYSGDQAAIYALHVRR